MAEHYSTPTCVSNQYFLSVEDFNDFFSENSFNGLNLLQINTCSIKDMSRFDRFLHFIESLTVKLDIIVVGETWIQQETIGLYNIPGFRAHFSCRNGNGGGLCVYVRNDLTHRVIEIIADDDFFSILIEVELNHRHSFKLSSIYRPPRGSSVEKLLNYLDGILSKYSGSNLLVVGDVNVNMRRLSSTSPNSLPNRYQDLMSSYDMSVLNGYITRLSTQSIIDHVCSNCFEKISTLNCTIENDLSDHNAILTNISASVHHRTDFFNQTHYNFDAVNDKLQIDVDSSKWPNSENVNLLYNYFSDCLDEALSQNSVTCTRPVRSERSPCPWMNIHLEDAIKDKNNLYNKYKRNRLNVRLALRLNEANLEVSKLNYFYKNKYYNNLFRGSISDSKKTWNNINKVLGKSKKKDCIESLIIDSQVIDNPVAISVNLNSFFAEIGHVYASRLHTHADDNVNLRRTLDYSNVNITLQPVTANEVLGLLQGLNTNKGPGLDGITAAILKKCSHVITPMLVQIINKAFSSGIYPDGLKKSRITPIFKDGDKMEPSNYRPISILPSVNKVFELTIKNRLVEFLCERNYFYSHQYGFRAKSGTHTAVFELINNISLDLDAGNFVSGVFLDLSKAFDCVNHSILLLKLDFAGIRGNALNLLSSYLSNRKQSVVIGDSTSPLIDVTIGVPQGSILGPLLFLTYVNDIARLPLSGRIFLYADDSAIFYDGINVLSIIDRIQEDMLILGEYFRLNRLCLNGSKSRIVHFRSARRTLPMLNDIMFDGSAIETVSQVKYLGIILDCNLSWKSHIVGLCKRLSSKVGILSRLRFFLPKPVMKQLYFALVHSSISYLAGIWGAACDSTLRPLQILQNRALKFSYKLRRDYPTSQLYAFEGSKVLNINSIYRFNVAKFVHQSLRDLAYHTIQFHPVAHTYNTRNRNRIHRPSVRRNFGLRAISVAGPSIYESVPSCIRSQVSYTCFVIQLKSWLHDNQYL